MTFDDLLRQFGDLAIQAAYRFMTKNNTGTVFTEDQLKQIENNINYTNEVNEFARDSQMRAEEAAARSNVRKRLG